MPEPEDFLRRLRRERAWTLQLVDAIPEDRSDWRPAADAFSCLELVRHLLQAERFWRRLLSEAIGGRDWDPFELTGAPAERMSSFRRPNLEASRSGRVGATVADCLDRWGLETESTVAMVAALSSRDLERNVVHPLTDLRLPVREALDLMLSHEIHHRGQLSAYLKTMGAPQPPLYL